ncbi:MAG: polynucleotide adenylyltransferase [Candidatus Dadabacteria bacterium]|nr:MAG: polynucleotide adenylyltransferase [Candidatus Dadabacteria bacterium]
MVYHPDIESITPDIYSRDQHTISRKDIDPDALKVMYRLIRHGYKAFLVGGGVRDLLLNKKPKDFDIGTDATPRKIKSLFRNCRIIGRRFKLCHIYFKNNKIIEVSTFRDFTDPSEVLQSDKKKVIPDNRFGNEKTDALRRDITINGLFYDLSTFSIIDYVGGMKDLREGIIRVIGDPLERFKEDTVRMLRVVRHAVRSNSVIEENCYQTILKHNSLITEASQVRVYEEIKKDLCSGFSLGILKLLGETGLLQHLIPELEDGSPAMLSEEHDFYDCLAVLDQKVRSGEAINATTSLTLIALFTGRVINKQALVNRFATPEYTARHVKKCFKKLAVPRKERERIETIINLWRQVQFSGPESINVKTLSRRQYLEELLNLIACIRLDQHTDELIELVEQAIGVRTKRLKRQQNKSKSKAVRKPSNKKSSKPKRKGT